MKIWKKVLLGSVVFALALGLTAYNLPRILTLLFPGDTALADNSQVLLKPVSVPDQDNGFFDFEKISNCTSYEPETCKSIIVISKGFDDLSYTNYVKPVYWDQGLVNQVLEQNRQALNLFDQAVDKNSFQIPDYTDPTKIHGDYKLYPMNPWRQISRLQAIKSISLSRQGKSDEALKEAVKLNKLGHQIIVGHNGLIGSLVGMAIQKLGSETLLEILPHGKPSSSTLELVRQVLDNSSNNVEGYKDAFRFEYTQIVQSLDESINQKIDEEIQQLIKGGVTTEARAKSLKYGYYYKSNQTKNLYTNLYGQHVATVGEKCDLGTLGAEINRDDRAVAGWKMLFTENLVGKLIYRATAISMDSVITKQCQNDLVSRIVNIELAMRSYKVSKGSLPENLSLLSPKYIPNIPSDPFDKKPIRYNAQKKILYSVGKDKQDLNGGTGTDWQQMQNPTFQIKF